MNKRWKKNISLIINIIPIPRSYNMYIKGTPYTKEEQKGLPKRLYKLKYKIKQFLHI